MSVYPYDIDDDQTIYRVDDNITEIGGVNFNQVRDAIFKIEQQLGIRPAGVKTDLSEFLLVSHNSDGTIKSSAFSSAGLVSLPIDNNDVGVNAGILESKLSLTYSTNTLKNLIDSNSTQISTLGSNLNDYLVKLNKHIGGDITPSSRHVLSHIDVNSIPIDTRDVNFTWAGLKNTSGGIRPATHLGQALEEINDELVDHQLATNPIFAHDASGIFVDSTNFTELPADINNVQDALEELDSAEDNRFGLHRATMHSSGIPAFARSEFTDGYGSPIVSSRLATTYLATTGTVPIDNTLNGDNVIQFNTPSDLDSRRQLDSEFILVSPGDIARVNYGTGIEVEYLVESIRFIPGSQWVIRINGINLVDTTDAYVRIDKPLFDKDIWNVAVAAASNAYPTSSFSGFYGSIILSNPRAAFALGLGFDPNQIDSTHYNLYLQLYPTGNPTDHVITLPAIDVSGNAGATPGDYTLETIIQATNNSFRKAGINARFIAFGYNGNFGIAMSDAINGASFSIINGERSSGTIIESVYTNNVIANISSPFRDGLGLGINGSNSASPAYSSAVYFDSIIALKPTKIFMPRMRKYYIVDGNRKDYFLSGPNTENGDIVDGYWTAELTSRTYVPGTSIKTVYTIDKDLSTAGLYSGKTITVQPLISFNNALYNNADYGRFIIDSIQLVSPCPGGTFQTIITVINGIHADPLGNAEGTSSGTLNTGFNVAIHYDSGSVGFNQNNLVDLAAGSSYHRLHEIYAKSDATTFSHERLRMPVQTAFGANLDTFNWRIRGASSKLRGFADTTTSQTKYIRFYILNYDITSGEFDGYIGRRASSVNTNIFDWGPITKGRKEIPCRFYDNTGNDYIELEFLETSTNALIPTVIAYPAYVDIQVFTSLELDKELLLLATCEVNWQSPSTQIVERVIDRRQIGSISEEEFTTSALDFISASDKYLHANGIIKGFDNFGLVSGDASSIAFGGGIAIVNGKIVISNPTKVKIPAIRETGSVIPATVNWAICVDENGQLLPVVITDTKDQYFAYTGGATSWYVQSMTFGELVSNRKDLTPIAMVNVSLTPLTIVSIVDARRFVENESFNIPFTWSEDFTNNTAHFRSEEALKTWILNTKSDNSYIKSKIIVRGDITLTSILDLSLVPNLTLESDSLGSSRITINADTGIKLKSNATLKNLSFIYNPITVPATSNYVNINLTTPVGCILITASSETIENINIENCQFSYPGTDAYRHPFISIVLTDSNMERCSFIKNYFTDTVAKTSAGIVIAETSNTGGAHSLLDSIFIEKNTSQYEEGIFIVGNSINNMPPITTRNVHISDNKCGYVGVNSNSSLSVATDNVQSGLFIKNNNCILIYGSVNTSGTLPATYTSLSNIIISENSCAGIDLVFLNNTNPYNQGQSAILISSNILNRTSTSILYGIRVLDNKTITTSAKLTPIKIIDNIIDSGTGYASSTLLEYNSGIYTNTPSIITGNSISGFTVYGIYAGDSSYTEATGSIIKNNYIFRKTNNITNYILSVGHDAIIAENIFDKTTVDGASENTISITGEAVVVRNINHVQSFYPRLSQGTPLWHIAAIDGYATTQPATDPVIWSRLPSTLTTISAIYESSIATTFSNSMIEIPLQGILPDGSKVLSVILTASSTGLFDIGDVRMYVDVSGESSISGTVLDFTSVVSATDTITVNKEINKNILLRLNCQLDDSADNRLDFIIQVKYSY